VFLDTERSLLLNHYTPYRLVNLAKRVSDACNQAYGAPNGVSVAQWRVLARLGQQKEVSSRGLPSDTFMDKSRVSRALQQLEDKGLVIARVDEDDNRAKKIALTDGGRELYQQIVPQALEWEASFLSTLSTTELRDFLMTMSKLEAYLSETN